MNAQPVRLSPLHSAHIGAGATLTTIENWQVATAMGAAANEAEVAKTGLGVADLSDRVKITIEGGDAGAMLKKVLKSPALSINQATKIGDSSLYVASLRRDRFYMSGPTGSEGDLLHKLGAAAAKAKSLITVTDETDARSELLLVGPNAGACLARVCALDFHDSAFPNHTAKQTGVAKIRQLVLRCDQGDLPAYIVSGGRSNAIYLWETLLRVGNDLDMHPIGRETVRALWVH